jgi:sigma-54 dependent transcriptional regulator, acetoin dehydrogenase operon transcriptional activator AcoR
MEMPMESSDASIRQAHALLEQDRDPKAELLPAGIYHSWRRCLDLGLDPRRNPEPRIETSAKLAEARERHAAVRRFALKELRELYERIAGTSFMVAFADPDCMLLDMIADPDFATEAMAASLTPGCIWSEALSGTNALGSSALDRRPMMVHGAEHFFSSHLHLTCIAHPVFAPDGSLAGVLDASTHSVNRQQHTQVLVRLAAVQIENSLFRESYSDHTIIELHQQSEYLRSLSAGLLAVRDDGQVIGANRQARNFLQGMSFTKAVKFEDVFSEKADTILDPHQHKSVRLKNHAGASFFAMVDPFHRSQQSLRPASRPKTKAPVRPAFVADDARVAAIVRQVESAAARALPLLIRGETGTGKELLARHAHFASGRSGAFVPVNCAALPDSLIEAELFGYADGSFTGARRGGAVGLVGEADGGTLFLDEIGDMPMTLQAVLLRLLDDWTVRPVGGKRSVVNVQLVSATNVKLDEAITAGRFRSDLLYRMNTLEVTLPPLAMRSDIEGIANHLLALYNPDCQLDARAVAALKSRAWPGNIRQLRNVLARASLAAVDGLIDQPTIDAACGTQLSASPAGHAGAIGPHSHSQSQPWPLSVAASPVPEPSLRDAQRERVLAVLAEVGGNISLAARRLGISRNTVYRTLGQANSSD